ncbi:uncharacterized protein LOC142141024 isoform X3 [Mixophyes fleayi]|uniref:uncharacterized protein LOC142141024 isoform X3 n=1 Tax=Mixophyes fleayi TaxID=3061075 RepID=UPI003F4DED35
MSSRSLGLCAFCHKREANKKTGEMLKAPGEKIMAHYNCVLFSPLVVSEDSDSQELFGGFNIDSVKREAERAKHLRCFHCKSSGASIGCDIRACRRTFHYVCVEEAKGKRINDPKKEKYIAFCENHKNPEQVNVKNGSQSDDDTDIGDMSDTSEDSRETTGQKKRKSHGTPNSARKIKSPKVVPSPNKTRSSRSRASISSLSANHKDTELENVASSSESDDSDSDSDSDNGDISYTPENSSGKTGQKKRRSHGTPNSARKIKSPKVGPSANKSRDSRSRASTSSLSANYKDTELENVASSSQSDDSDSDNGDISYTPAGSSGKKGQKRRKNGTPNSARDTKNKGVSSPYKTKGYRSRASTSSLRANNKDTEKENDANSNQSDDDTDIGDASDSSDNSQGKSGQKRKRSSHGTPNLARNIRSPRVVPSPNKTQGYKLRATTSVLSANQEDTEPTDVGINSQSDADSDIGHRSDTSEGSHGKTGQKKIKRRGTPSSARKKVTFDDTNDVEEEQVAELPPPATLNVPIESPDVPAPEQTSSVAKIVQDLQSDRAIAMELNQKVLETQRQQIALQEKQLAEQEKQVKALAGVEETLSRLASAQERLASAEEAQNDIMQAVLLELKNMKAEMVQGLQKVGHSVTSDSVEESQESTAPTSLAPIAQTMQGPQEILDSDASDIGEQELQESTAPSALAPIDEAIQGPQEILDSDASDTGEQELQESTAPSALAPIDEAIQGPVVIGHSDTSGTGDQEPQRSSSPSVLPPITPRSTRSQVRSQVPNQGPGGKRFKKTK